MSRLTKCNVINFTTGYKNTNLNIYVHEKTCSGTNSDLNALRMYVAYTHFMQLCSSSARAFS